MRIYPDPILRKPTWPVRPGSAEARAISEALLEAFARVEGLGLAANQIGFPLRAAVVRLEENAEPLVLLNPRVLWRSEELAVEEEGCLSLPGVWAEVPRPRAVKVEYQDGEGARHVIEAEGLNARLLLHELDHLDGVLFIDRLPPAERQRVLRVFREVQARKESAPSAAQVRA
ncbi:MAG: peptide deformylase [Candidatus Bipolaricaulaceae bacterium]